MKNHFILLIICFMVITSCKTTITINPVINSSPRSEMGLDNPIVISIKDSRTNMEEGTSAKDSLQNSLSSIYGNNVLFSPYFSKTDSNSVRIKINIKQIGAQFGTRTIEYQTYHNQITAASNSVSNYWGTTVSTVIVSQPIVKNNQTVQGYWVGTSYLEISLVDKLNGEVKTYNFPFAAEDFQNNTLGYKSGKIAAQNSWNKVSSSLLDLIDGIALRLIEVSTD